MSLGAPGEMIAHAMSAICHQVSHLGGCLGGQIAPARAPNANSARDGKSKRYLNGKFNAPFPIVNYLLMVAAQMLHGDAAAVYV